MNITLKKTINISELTVSEKLEEFFKETFSEQLGINETDTNI